MLPLPLFFLLCLFFFSIPGSVFAQEDDFKPLSLYLGDDPFTLGTGGLNAGGALFLPAMERPASLIGAQRSFSLFYSDQNVLNAPKGDWKGSSVKALSREATVVLPMSLPLLGSSTLGFSGKNHDYTARVAGAQKAMSYESIQNYDTAVIAFGASPAEFIKVGAGVESLRKNVFYEIVLIPHNDVSLTYRTLHQDMTLRNSLMKSANLAELTLKPSTETGEISLQAGQQDIFNIAAAWETRSPGNRKLLLTMFPFPGITMNLHVRNRRLDFFEGLRVNGQPEGHVSAGMDYSARGGEVRLDRSVTRYIIGFRESLLRFEGAGKISGSSILNFWENLIAGDRYFTFGLALDSLQYNLGIEREYTDRLTIRGGFQYIIAKPNGEFDNWTPFPIVNIGRLDEEISTLEYRKAVLGALGFGLSYRLDSLEFTYGFGQIIPIKLYRAIEKPAASGENGAGVRESIWDKIRQDPGGNIHSMNITWYF